MPSKKSSAETPGQLLIYQDGAHSLQVRLDGRTVWLTQAAMADLFQTTPQNITLHADRGTSMKSKPVALLLSDLGVTKTHSRPHVSNDNPFSESQFKTMKYRPEFPDRFGSIQDGRSFCTRFFNWYDNEHRHSGIAMLTPADVHYGHAQRRIEQRAAALLDAFEKHPERFVNKCPEPRKLPEAVWINPPKMEELKTAH